MRILVAFMLIIVLGGIVTAAHRIPSVNLTSAQLDQIKSNCTQCHKVPVVTSAAQIHNSHLNVDCAVCHPGGNRERVNFNSCLPCHSVPQYTSTLSVHNAHAGTACIDCHSADDLSATDKANGSLQVAGIGLVSFGVLGIIVNYAVAAFRLRRK